MHRILGMAGAVVLTLTVLTGCGGDDGGSGGAGGYCDDLSTAKDSFVGLLNNQIDQDTFVELRDSLPALQAEAPAKLAKDWTTFESAVDAFSEAMKKAGLTMDDMRDMGTGSMAGGTDMETAMNAAAALGSAAVSTAQSAIRADALTRCDLDFSS
jgi:hypothetical protein